MVVRPPNATSEKSKRELHHNIYRWAEIPTVIDDKKLLALFKHAYVNNLLDFDEHMWKVIPDVAEDDEEEIHNSYERQRLLLDSAYHLGNEMFCDETKFMNTFLEPHLRRKISSVMFKKTRFRMRFKNSPAPPPDDGMADISRTDCALAFRFASPDLRRNRGLVVSIFQALPQRRLPHKCHWQKSPVTAEIQEEGRKKEGREWYCCCRSKRHKSVDIVGSNFVRYYMQCVIDNTHRELLNDEGVMIAAFKVHRHALDFLGDKLKHDAKFHARIQKLDSTIAFPYIKHCHWGL